MAQIHQSDIWQYISKNWGLHYSLKEICDLLDGKVPISLKNSRISEMQNMHKTGLENLSADLLLDTFVKPYIREKSSDELISLLRNLIQHNLNSNIDFPDVCGRPNDSYESYVRRMIECGVSNYTLPPASKKTNTPINPPGKAVLHSQNLRTVSNFTGRDEFISKIFDFLNGSHNVVLSGIGGIGKTFLANRYAVLHKNDYVVTQYLSCDQENTQFQQLLLQLQFDHLDEQEWSDEDKLKKRISYLKKTTIPTLLIFDNLNHVPEDMNLYSDLLIKSNIHFIITTRLTRTSSGGIFSTSDQIIKVPPLPHKEQRQLFETHLGCPIPEEDSDLADDILKCIEGHTLLIELVAKSIDQGELSFQEMLDNLYSCNDSCALPNVNIEKDACLTQDRPWHFVKTILFNIMPLSESQRSTMRFLSLLPTDGISRKLFYHLDAQASNTLPFLEQESWSIVVRSGPKKLTRLHPIIREVIRSELSPSPDNCHDFLESLCQFTQTPESACYSEDLQKLSRSILASLSFTDFPCNENIHILCKFAEFLNKQYHYTEALMLYQTALNIWDQIPAPDSDIISCCSLHTRIGELHQRLAHYKKAIEHFQVAIKATAPDSQSRAYSYRKLGEVYRKDSNYEKALLYDNKALELLTDPNDIAEAKNAIGVVYLNMGDTVDNSEDKYNYYIQAKDYYLTALDLWQKNDGPIKNIAFSTHNIGTAYHKLADYKNAAKYHRKAFEIRRDHKLDQTYIAASHAWLAKDYMAIGDYTQAKEEIDHSLEIRRKLLGENHPDYAWSLSALCDWYQATGDLMQAISTIKMVLMVRTKALGEDHEYTKQAERKLQKLLSSQL